MILIIQNITREGPGLIEEVLKDKKIGYEIYDLDQGDGFPNIEKYDGVIVLGGPDSANDNTYKIMQELSQIKKTIHIGKPYLGICLGLQLLVKANGGEVISGRKEVGWGHHIKLTEDGKKDPLFHSLPNSMPIFHLHSETVKLTNETLLATGDVKVQAIKLDNAYSIQGHLELTEEIFDTLMKKDPDLVDLDAKEQVKKYHELKEDYEKTGRKLVENWLKIVDLNR